MSDLISRKAIIKKIEGIFIHVTGIRSGKGILAEWMNKYRDTVLSAIREEPTIEAIPVVHGEWIEVDDDIDVWYECSECGASSMSPYKFCHECGARMEFEE